MTGITNLFDHNDGWILETTKGELKVFYKVGEGGLISLKMEGIVNVSVLNIVTIINEPDSYEAWVPFCKIGKTVINKYLFQPHSKL